jgi:1,4-dihydroxy-2-naphthoate polyprenyltransferase
MDENRSALSQIVKISRPGYIILGFLFYALGVGISQYLGTTIAWDVFFIGQACIMMLQLSCFYLKEYFDRIETPGQGPKYSYSPEKRKDDFTIRLLQMAVTTLATGAALTVVLFFLGAMTPIVLFFLGFAFLLAFFQSVPPIRFSANGYGDLIEAFLHACLVPTLAFLWQYGELHRLLAMITFPLTFLYLAMCLARSFPDYGNDLQMQRKSLLTLLGWQHAMNLHNLLIFAAYLVFIASFIIGLPWSLTWPPLLVVPLGVYQIWQMNAISTGSKPNWQILVYTAVANLCMAAYFMTLSLWVG